MRTVTPIDRRVRRQVVAATDEWIECAKQVFGRPFSPIPIAFDLIGRAFGLYRADQCGRLIRYNPYLFAKYFTEGMSYIVPHEVGHYVADVLHGSAIRAHGAEWRRVMDALRTPHRLSIKIDFAGIPVRRERRFGYRCACRGHNLTTRAHHKVLRGSAVYRCRHCDERLIFEGSKDVARD